MDRDRVVKRKAFMVSGGAIPGAPIRRLVRRLGHRIGRLTSDSTSEPVTQPAAAVLALVRQGGQPFYRLDGIVLQTLFREA